MKKLLALLLSLLMSLSMLSALAEEAPADAPVSFTIFHTNDVHGRYNTDAGMGYAMMASFVNAARANGENVLVLDAGDTLHGTVFANTVQGMSVVEIMNAVGYSAMAPGNHDYNYGYDRLVELSESMAFPLVCANVLLADGSHAFETHTIIEIEGKKIAIVGADNPELVSSIHPDHTKDIVFAGVEEVEKVVAAIRGEVDFLIVLAHWGCTDSYHPNSMDALATIEGVDLVIDGHSHTPLFDIVQNDAEGAALVASTGEYLHNVGKIVVTLGAEENTVEATLIPDPGLYEDHAIINAIEEVEAAQGAVLDTVIGATSVELVGERGIVRTTESNWGNLACDIFLHVTGAHCAMMNGGGIRASLPAGDITMRDVLTVFPFGNYVVLQEVSGQAILDALEVGLSLYPESNGGFPQIGGMQVTFDPAKEAGARIVELLIAGEPVDPAAMYKLATNDYLAAGGDNYASLKEFPVLFSMGFMDEVVVDYLKDNSPVAPEVEGRLVVVQ